ncbi:MAG: hypothetical protein HRT44_01075 [Bdellovibrionales bacterium]|nr:hypothetical protein [Bdellovibrionales bacterium]NQZ17842.1 hypothetical protein [Bdellovibrionales bacterium]
MGIAQNNSNQPNRRHLLKMLVSAGIAAATNPTGLAAHEDAALPDWRVPEVWTEIYERHSVNGVLTNTKDFLKEMRELEIASGKAMKPVVRDLIYQWESYLAETAATGVSHKAEQSMFDRTLSTLDDGPRVSCRYIFSLP